jgi:tetratricopeptide (TPR) repeat protein
LLLLQLERHEEMAAEIRAALALHAENPRVVLLGALVEAQEKSIEEAMPLVQTALNRASAQVPSLAGMVASLMGVRFLGARLPFAALQHLTLGINLNPNNENTSGLLRALMQQDEVSLLYKEDRSMQPATVSHSLSRERGEDPGGESPADWSSAFDDTCALADRGAWLAAAEGFEALKEQAGESKSLWHNLGVCCAAIGRNQEAADALRRYAELETNLDDAVETEALAELLWPVPTETIQRLAIRYPVKKASALKQALESDARFFETTPGTSPEEGGPSPEKSRYSVLDRPRTEFGPDVDFATVPRAVGLVELGDAPDSEPELTLVAFAGERAEAAAAALRETAGDSIGEPGEPEVLGEISKEQIALSLAWVPPKGVPAAAMREIFEEGHKHVIEEVWINLPRARFGGKSPREAAADPSLHARLLAEILALELEELPPGVVTDWNGLREHLGLPRCGAIDPEECDVDQVPLVRLHRVLADRLADEDLTSLVSLAAGCSANRAFERFGEELTRRPHLKDEIDFGFVYTTLSKLARDRGERERALEWVAAGRAFDREQNETRRAYEWDLLEVLTRLMEPDDEQLKPLIQDYLSNYRDNPVASQRMMELLVSVGAIRPEQLAAKRRESEQETVRPTSSRPGIWTPTGDQPQGEKVKIWTPGDA